MNTLRIGTRASQLALWQAHYARNRLLEIHSALAVELVPISTEGDRTLDVPLATVGGKGLFLKELEQALLGGRIDVAVHSMKDVTVSLPPGLHIAAICERADPRDAFVSNRYATLAQLPAGARVGTCSLRRRCLLSNRYPELCIAPLRGNVNTRLARLDAGDFDAIILAAAGLKRLQLDDRIRELIPAEVCLPAVGQGAVGLECRRDDVATNTLVAPLDHAGTRVRVLAERAANARLQGGCHVPLAVYAELAGAELVVRGAVGHPEGSQLLRAEVSGPASEAEEVGAALAEALLVQEARQILDAVYAGR